GRQGIVYRDGSAWTLRDYAWLARQSFDQPAVQFPFDLALEEVMLAAARRDRLDKAIIEMARASQWSPVVTRLQCLRGVSMLTRVLPCRGDRRLGAVHRLEHRCLPRPGPERELQRRAAPPRLDHQGRQHARPSASGGGGLASP